MSETSPSSTCSHFLITVWDTLCECVCVCLCVNPEGTLGQWFSVCVRLSDSGSQSVADYRTAYSVSGCELFDSARFLPQTQMNPSIHFYSWATCGSSGWIRIIDLSHRRLVHKTLRPNVT